MRQSSIIRIPIRNICRDLLGLENANPKSLEIDAHTRYTERHSHEEIMSQSTQDSVTIRGLTVDRRDVINHLIFPPNPLLKAPEKGALTLPVIVRDYPAKLEALGLVQQEVFGASCTDVAGGTWTVRARRVWIDQAPGVPVDSGTVMFIDQLPDTLSASTPRDLINFLPPTYCRKREDAERLARLFEQMAPSERTEKHTR